MKVEILREAGYEEAQTGLALSYSRPVDEKRGLRLYNKDGGHNKFLESINVWITITAPRYFWSQFDTYRVGMSKQSESTMHTILRGEIKQGDFEAEIQAEYLAHLNRLREAGELMALKNALPEGYLQKRIVATNYKCLRNILLQRRRHANPLWQFFCREIKRQVEHPEFFGDIAVV